MEPPPPEQIELGDVVLRRYRPEDAPALADAARASLDHLAPWMAWATDEGVTPEAMGDFIARSTAQAADGSEAVYGIYDPDGRFLGGCGLHDRLGPGALEIGYWLRADATGQGLMTRVAGALTDLVLARGDIARVEIHCDEANVRSAGVPRRLGFALTGVVDRAIEAPAETGRQQVWTRTTPTGVG